MSIPERAQEYNQCFDIRTGQLAAKPGHLAFDAVLDPVSNPGIAQREIVKGWAFITSCVIPMAMGAVPFKQSASAFGGDPWAYIGGRTRSQSWRRSQAEEQGECASTQDQDQCFPYNLHRL